MSFQAYLDRAMQREMLNEDADVEMQQQDCPTMPDCGWWQERFEEVGGGELRSIGFRCENDKYCLVAEAYEGDEE